MGLMSGGALGGAYMGYKSAKNANKAQKERMRLLREGLNQYKAGSLDAFGNKLSADKNGLWSYNLTLPTKIAKRGAEKAMTALGNYNYKTGEELGREDLLLNAITNGEIARANQAAAMKSGMRNGSNLGYISNAYSKNRDKNIRNAFLNSKKAANNSALYNANVVNQLANTASNAMSPINSVQNNLQGMVNSLNKNVMDQYNTMASAVQPKQDTLSAAMKGADTGFRGSLKDINSLIKTGKNAYGLYSMMG